MPILYYVPMIHTPQELGSLKDAILAVRLKVHGEKTAAEFLKEIKLYWQEVERRITHAGLYRPEIASRLHVFVDSLPHTAEVSVKKMVEEFITQKIPAYLIIQKFLAHGATVHGTEDPELLLREHSYWTEIAQGKTHDPIMAQGLLRNRDRAIAQRISLVVPNEENGLLFIGRAHDVLGELNRLPKKFKVIHL